MDDKLQTGRTPKIDKIQDDIFYSTGEADVSLGHLMNRHFILENTDFDSWENLLSAARVGSENDLEKPDFSEFIKRHTRFEDWEAMLIHSANQYYLSYQEE